MMIQRDEMCDENSRMKLGSVEFFLSMSVKLHDGQGWSRVGGVECRAPGWSSQMRVGRNWQNNGVIGMTVLIAGLRRELKFNAIVSTGGMPPSATHDS
jgi:hypothetical protein